MHVQARALYLLIAIQLLAMGAMEMSGPFWPLQIQALLGQPAPGLTALLSSAVYAGPMLAAMLLAPLWGRLGDRTGYKPMLLRALLALALCQGLAAVVSNAWGLVAVRVAQGALAGFLAAAQAYALFWCDSGARGRTLALLQTVTAIGSLLGPLLGGWLIDTSGFSLLCLSAAAICLVCAAAALWLPQDTPRASAHQHSARTIAPKRWLASLLLVIVLIQTAKMMPQPFYALYLTEVLQAPAWLIGATYAASALTLALSAPLWGHLFDHWQPAHSLRVIESVAWLSCATLAAAALAQGWQSFLVTRLLWGLWQGALLPMAFMLIARTVSPSQHGYALGLGHSAAKAGALLGILLGGAAMLANGLAHAFWFVALAYLCAALCIGQLRRSAKANASLFSTSSSQL
ncbi:MFS transporter [Lampropedia aestuarii]|uniref:MFS transporter n=1 Tax=Lampropedia aestuarii TaxID=2562762 RepID=UPI0024695BD2|nr:MFS transporter [Lampropedia aestuarii]MDH5857544.1 MFS transporter [Lampropedia aestuarii]